MFKKIIISVCLFCLVILTLFCLLFALIHNRSFQSYIVRQAVLFSGYKIETGDIQFLIQNDIEIRVNDLKARSIAGDKTLRILSAQIQFDKIALLTGRVVPRKIVLLKPDLQLDNCDILKSLQEEKQSDLKQSVAAIMDTLSFVSVRNGRVFVADQDMVIDDLFVDLSKSDNNPLCFTTGVRGNASYKEKNTSFTIAGDLGRQTDTQEDSMFAEMTIHAPDLPLIWFPKTIYFHFEDGVADTDIRFNVSSGSPLKLSGKIVSKKANYIIWSQRKEKAYAFPEAVIDMKAVYFDRVFNISSKIATMDFSLDTSVDMDLRKKVSPYLDLKVSSSFMDLLSFKQIFPTPVVPNWIEDSLFPIFTSGQVRCDVFGIRGDLKRIRELKQPENKDVLTLKLALKHIETIKQNESFPFTSVSGEVAIENGMLNVSDVKGVFGESSISKAWLDIDSLYSKDSLYRYYIDGVFNLQDLKQQSNMDVAPGYVKEKFQGVTELSGKLKASIQFDYKKTYDYPKLNFGTFFFSRCLMMHQGLKLPIFLNDTEIIIDENRKNRFKGHGFWGNSSVEVKGSADNIYEKGSAEVICSADINEIIKNTSHRGVSFAKFSKLMPGRFFLTGEKGIWSCTGEADLNGMSVDIGKFSTAKLRQGDRIAFDLDIYPKEKINFRNIQCNIGKSFLNGYGFLGIKKKPLHFNVLTSLSLEDTNLFYNKKKIKAAGTVTSDAKISTSLSDYSKLSIDGELKANHVSFGYKDKPPKFEKGNLDVTFSGKDAVISSIQFMMDKSRIGISGHLQGWDIFKGDLLIHGDSVDFEPVVSFLAKVQPKEKRDRIDAIIKKSNINININVENGMWRKLNFSRISAKSLLNQGVFTLDTCDIDMKEGALALTGYVKLLDKPETMLSGYVNLVDYPLMNLLESFKLEDDVTVSSASWTPEGFLAGKGSTGKQMVSNLSGSLNLHLAEGRIQKQGFIFNILNFLSLQNIIDLRFSYFSKEGFYFKSFKGNIDIEHGVLSTDNFVLESPVFNAAGKGQVNLIEKKTDVDLGIAPLGTIDSIIDKVPIVGYILTGDNKAFVTYYIKVKGPMANPEIHYVPFKHWPAGILGFFKRTFFTPGRVLKEMDEIKDKVINKGFFVPGKK